MAVVKCDVSYVYLYWFVIYICILKIYLANVRSKWSFIKIASAIAPLDFFGHFDPRNSCQQEM